MRPRANQRTTCRDELHLERPDDRLRNLLLHGKHVLEASVVTLRPDNAPVGIHELDPNLEAIARTPNASFQDVLDVQ